LYQEFFGFREAPFRITPDPRVLYRNRCYDEAIAALAYGIEQRKGFMSLVGEVGTGKTTLLRHVLETVAPNVRTVLLLYPTISFEEILEQVLTELGVPVGSTSKGVMLQRLHEFLLEHTGAGGNVALLFDEGQALETRTLEELRLISNFETGTEKIVQIVLAGQPELEEKLRQPEHRQLRQRIALHVRLRPLNAEEVADYIRVRLQHVDAPDLELFTPEAVARVAELTAGIPRVVNVLCDASCTTAFALGRRQIDRTIVDETWVDYAGLAPDVSATTAAPEPFLPPPPPLFEAPAAAAPPRPSTPPPAPPRPAAPPPPPLQRTTASEPMPADDLPGDDEDGGEERWPVIVAFALGVVLAGFVMVQLFRRAAPVPDVGHEVPPAVASAPAPAAPVAAPAVPSPLLPPPAASDTPPTPAPPASPVSDAPSGPPVTGTMPPRTAAGVAAPSAVDALDVVDDFRRAYEQRNLERLGMLFAPDAHKGALAGRDAILADYQRFFANARDLLYSQPSAAVEPHAGYVVVRAPFEITYKDTADRSIEVKGIAAWTLVRRDGGTVIQRLDFEIAPVAAAR
jgi:general secretion pathway protein A